MSLSPFSSAAPSRPSSAAAGNDGAPWRRLPSLTDTEGVAGPFVGAAGDTLLLAGGTNFVDGRPWSGGRKTWHDFVQVLDTPGGAWRTAGRLPRPLGYGAAVSWREGVLCIGGGDADAHYGEVFLLRIAPGGGLVLESFPPLPETCAYHAAVLMGDRVYVAGGQVSPQSQRALHVFWRLDLARPGNGWRKLGPWRGPGRMMAVLGAMGESLYLFGGYDLVSDSSGGVRREFLRDVYRYRPDEGWTRCNDVPRPVVATPSPALPVGATHLVLLGWNDGTLGTIQPPEARPNFPADILSYNVAADRWRIGGRVPFPSKVTPVVRWRDLFVVASGEIQPGIRTPHVWAMSAADLPALIVEQKQTSP